MSKPVFQDVFKFEGRRNRKSYILIQLATFAGLFASAFVGIIGLGMYDNGGAAAVLACALILVGGGAFVALTIGAWLTSAQRVRDIGYSGVWCLIQLLPYIGWVASLAITIAPGDTLVANKYGESLIGPFSSIK